jgi:leader peptidase (prepilin peptidase)/N-methyltransferase
LTSSTAGGFPWLAVALGGAALAGFAGSVLPLQPLHMLASAALGGCMAGIAAEDLRHFRVPDVWNAAAALAGLLAALAEADASGRGAAAALGAAVLAMALCGGALWLVREIFYRRRGFDGLGLGDVKLAATGGTWLGWEPFPVALLLAAMAALAWIGVRTWTEGAWARERRIPFAAFLAPAIWAVWYAVRLVVPA